MRNASVTRVFNHKETPSPIIIRRIRSEAVLWVLGLNTWVLSYGGRVDFSLFSQSCDYSVTLFLINGCDKSFAIYKRKTFGNGEPAERSGRSLSQRRSRGHTHTSSSPTHRFISCHTALLPATHRESLSVLGTSLLPCVASLLPNANPP